MSTDYVSEKVKREAHNILSNEGPMTHDELSESLGLDWDQTQTVVRALRNEDRLSIAIDRRYEAEKTN